MHFTHAIRPEGVIEVVVRKVLGKVRNSDHVGLTAKNDVHTLTCSVPTGAKQLSET